MHLLEAPTSRCSIVGRASFAKGRAASLHELAEPPNTHAGKLRRRSAKGRLRTSLRSKTRRGIYQRRLGKTAAPFRRGPCRKLAVGLGPAARPGTATSIFTPLSSMRWNYRAHLSGRARWKASLDELDGTRCHRQHRQKGHISLTRRVAEWSPNPGTSSLDQHSLACAIYALALFGQLGGRERSHTCHPNATFTTRRRPLVNGSTA